MTKDEGAMAVLVAIVLVAMLGVAALVVDVGLLYAERRQLQNGADAAALAVAYDCPGAGGCDSSTSASGTAGRHANANANDAATEVTDVCGTAPGLQPCAGSSAAWDCPPPGSSPAPSARYVQVRTATRTGSGSSLVPNALEAVVNPGYAGSTVRACARAAYGPAQTAKASLALTISACEWDAATAGGTSYAPPPPYPPNPAATYEKKIFLHTTTGADATDCPAGPSGSDLPGGFGWLEDPNGNCTTVVDVDGTYQDKTGVGTPKDCKIPMDAASSYPVQNVLYIPVYDEVTGTGGNGTYGLKGFAAFVLTGYSLPGGKKNSWLTGQPCGKGSDMCISGFFTEQLQPTSGVIGSGPSMGVNVVQMTG